MYFLNNARGRTFTAESVSLWIGTQCNKTTVLQLEKSNSPAKRYIYLKKNITSGTTFDGYINVRVQFKAEKIVQFIVLWHYTALIRSSDWNFTRSYSDDTTVWFNFFLNTAGWNNGEGSCLTAPRFLLNLVHGLCEVADVHPPTSQTIHTGGLAMLYCPWIGTCAWDALQ